VPITLEPDAPKIEHPSFGPRIPRDTGAIWYFEEVRNFYLEALYNADASSLRREDPDRYLYLSRAVTAEVMETTFAEWRRTGSSTRGGLVWFFQDLWPGAGWGVVDSWGEPKSSYYALKRAFKPLTVLLTDEGLNGLDVHLVNETAAGKPVRLTLTCLRYGQQPVMRAEREIYLAPRSTIMLKAADLWGGFFDTNYSYRFGEPSHDVTCAQLTDARGTALIAEAFHFPLGRGTLRRDIGLEAELEQPEHGWQLKLTTSKFAQSVHISADGFQPDDNWFHLMPGHVRRIHLLPRSAAPSFPKVCVAALNSDRIANGSLP